MPSNPLTPPPPSSLRVWFVHDWLTGLRGGEKVLLELVRLFPNSRIATLLHLPGTTHPDLDARVARTSFLQHLPRAATAYRNYLPLFPRAIRSLHLDPDCDLVFSVSHAVAKGITVPPNIPHLCYCNTPMRYIWGMEDHYLPRLSLKRLALAAAAPALRRFDLQNDHVTRFIANSQTVADRIARIYHRDSTIIHPGIDETFYTPAPPNTPREDFYLIVSALVPYKRIDLAISACLAANRKLIIIGTGPEEQKLRALAAGAPNIHLLGRQPDPVLLHHYQHAKALLFPGEEDFGLTPLEAQACGTPVLACHAGGATETIINQTTGLFFTPQTPAALRAAVTAFESLPPTTFTPAALRANALRFTWSHFDMQILAAVQDLVSAPAPALRPDPPDG